MIGNAVSIIVQFLGVIFIARVVGATSFGIIAIANIPISLATIFMNIGINSALIKYLSQYRFDSKPQYRRVLIETGAMINFTVGIILTSFTYLSSTYIAVIIFEQPELIPLIKLNSFILIGQTLFNTANSVFVGYERMKLSSVIDILYNLLRSIIGPVLVFLGWGAIGAVTGNVASQIVTGLVGFVMVRAIWKSELSNVGDLTHIECAKLMLEYGHPFFFSSLLAGINSNVTNFLLARYVAPEYIGNYYAATRFGILITFFTVPISIVIFPLFSKLEKQGDILRAMFVNSVKYMGLIIYPIIAAIIALASEIVIVLYGQGYTYANIYMRLFMPTFCYIGLGAISMDSLISVKNTQVIFYKTLIKFIVSIPLGFMLIPRFGVNGLIIAGILGTIPGFVYGLHWIQKNLDIEPDYVTAFKTIIAAASAGFATHIYLNSILVNPWIKLFTGGVLYILTYITSILLLRVLKQQDLDNIENISRGGGRFYRIIKKISLHIRPLI